jgi:NADH-quinone oxidoreductase subunit C
VSHWPQTKPNDGIAARVQELHPTGVLQVVEHVGEVTIAVAREALVDVVRSLRDDPALRFDMLLDICGIDWPERPERFDVVYHLISMATNRRVRLKVATDEATPVASLTGLFPVAGWFEREVWDCYGVLFEGNPDLRRILTDYGFQGHPFRKDFPLTGYVEMRYDPEQGRVVYQPVTIEPREITPRIIREDSYATGR